MIYSVSKACCFSQQVSLPGNTFLVKSHSEVSHPWNSKIWERNHCMMQHTDLLLSNAALNGILQPFETHIGLTFRVLPVFLRQGGKGWRTWVTCAVCRVSLTFLISNLISSCPSFFQCGGRTDLSCFVCLPHMKLRTNVTLHSNKTWLLLQTNNIFASGIPFRWGPNIKYYCCREFLEASVHHNANGFTLFLPPNFR